MTNGKVKVPLGVVVIDVAGRPCMNDVRVRKPKSRGYYRITQSDGRISAAVLLQLGSCIHTYMFDEAVADKVVLDLKYEARDVPQRLTSKKAIDAWFDQKTKGLNNFQRSVLRKRWATMEELMSAGERKQRIIADIIHDFGVQPRLNNDRGTAILVAASIYDACHYFRLFQNTSFGKYCGIITSYEPNHNAISREPKDSDERYKFDTYTQHVLQKDQTTKDYEDKTKQRFIDEPANLKLLIVVSKLLTGFDAPSCTYSLGQLGDVKPVAPEVYEMREFFGPGWRMYYARRGDILILMLGGGTKATQARDIAKAIAQAEMIEE